MDLAHDWRASLAAPRRPVKFPLDVGVALLQSSRAMPETAIVLADGLYRDPHAKTTHAMVRGPSRYQVVGVIDATAAGEDAGELLDGRRRGIPIFESVRAALDALDEQPTHCVIGVATGGGVLPPALRTSLEEAARAGLTLVNGLHRLLADDAELARLAADHGGGIVDVRRPKPFEELRFWSGEILGIDTPIVPVLGVDCAAGKRTTSWLLRAALERRGVRVEVIYTGQTGWLQGGRYGFILDATLNDFVCGELEGAVLACHEETRPDLMLVEGQAALRNPSGPCGAELIISTGARGVVLQHVPGRGRYIDSERVEIPIKPVAEEIEIVRLLGADVWAMTLHEEALDSDEAQRVAESLERELGLPVARPLAGGAERVAEVLCERLELA